MSDDRAAPEAILTDWRFFCDGLTACEASNVIDPMRIFIPIRNLQRDVDAAAKPRRADN
jgi:hypothetical protein